MAEATTGDVLGGLEVMVESLLVGVVSVTLLCERHVGKFGAAIYFDIVDTEHS